jgi:CAAX protease family protein
MTLSLPILALAAVVTALLYVLMRAGRDEQGAGAPPRALAFAVLGGVVVLLLAAVRAPSAEERTQPQDDMGRAFRSYTQALLDARRSFVPFMIQTLRQETPAKVRALTIREYKEAIRYAPSSRLFRRQLGILLASQGQWDAARAEFHELAVLQRKRGEAGAEAEARLWAQLVASSPLPRAAVPALRDQIRALDLGWFEHLALATLGRRAGETRLAEQESAKAEEQAQTQILLLGGLGLGMFLLALIGFLGAPILLFLVARGHVKPVPFQSRIAPALLWEVFILYLFLYAVQAVPQLLFPALRRPATERGMAQTILTILGSDAVQILSVLYLGVMLRQRRLGLREIGLHAQALLTNVTFGLAGYVVALPWVFAVSYLTEWLGRRYFPNVAPPFHPLQALTAGTHDGWLRFALFAIAAIGAPFFEELFFRGALYGALRRRFGIAVGVILSAGLFASLHPQLPLGFLPIFFLGAVFALLYEWRQSLIPGMAFHAVNNGVIFLLLNVLYAPGG